MFVKNIFKKLKCDRIIKLSLALLSKYNEIIKHIITILIFNMHFKSTIFFIINQSQTIF